MLGTSIFFQIGLFLTLAEPLSVSIAGSVDGLPDEFLVDPTRSVRAQATSFAAINNMT